MNRIFTLTLAGLILCGIEVDAKSPRCAVAFSKKGPKQTASVNKSPRMVAREAAMKYLPAKAVVSVWDADAAEWTEVEEISYTYNPDGTVATETESEIGSGGNELIRTTYGYDEEQRQTLSIVEMSDDGGDFWINDQKRVKEYDAMVKDFVTLNEIYSWNNNSWTLSSGNRYLLDRDSDDVLTLAQRQVMYQGDYDTTAKVENTVADGAVVTSKVSELYNYNNEFLWMTNIDLRDIVWANTNGQPMGFEVEEYSRGANRIASAKSYYADEFEGDVKGVYKNDFEGTFVFSFIDESKLEIVTEYTDETTGSFREIYRVSYPYFDEQTGEEIETEELEVTTITYNEHGDIVEEHQSLSYDGFTEFSGGAMYEYEYDDNGTMTGQTISSFAEYEDEECKMQKEIYPEYRLQMSDFIAITGLEAATIDLGIRLDGRRVIVTGQGASCVEVYSLDGNRVLSSALDGAGEVSLEGLVGGMYLVRISSREGVRTFKVAL